MCCHGGRFVSIEIGLMTQKDKLLLLFIAGYCPNNVLLTANFSALLIEGAVP